MADERSDPLRLDSRTAKTIRSRCPSEQEAQALASSFRALGDPTRLAVALALREGGELCVADLAWIVDRAENLVSHHLRALRVAEIADFRRDGKMAFYWLTERGQALLAAVEAE